MGRNWESKLRVGCAMGAFRLQHFPPDWKISPWTFYRKLAHSQILDKSKIFARILSLLKGANLSNEWCFSRLLFLVISDSSFWLYQIPLYHFPWYIRFRYISFSYIGFPFCHIIFCYIKFQFGYIRFVISESVISKSVISKGPSPDIDQNEKIPIGHSLTEH